MVCTTASCTCYGGSRSLYPAARQHVPLRSLVAFRHLAFNEQVNRKKAECLSGVLNISKLCLAKSVARLVSKCGSIVPFNTTASYDLVHLLPLLECKIRYNAVCWTSRSRYNEVGLVA